MRRYNQHRERHTAQEYSHEMQEEYRDRHESDRGPRERPNGALARVRVELKRKYNDPKLNFKEMLQEFRRRVSNAGIMHDFKDHQYYESKGERRRKAKRDSQKKLLMEALTKKIIAGERIDGHGGMVKKILSNMKKEKDKREEKERKKKERQQERQSKNHED